MKASSLVVEGKEIQSLIDYLKTEFQAAAYPSEPRNFQILAFEKYYMRVSHYLAGFIVFEFDNSTSCKVLMIVAAEGTGAAYGLVPTGINYGAAGSFLNEVREHIEEYANHHDLKIGSIDLGLGSQFTLLEPYASPMKKCVKCGREIHLTSQKCGYCGAQQPPSK
jgi:hypothetical protein